MGEYVAGGCGFSLDRSGRLQMAHFNQGRADGDRLLAVEEDRTGLGLGGGRHDGADGLALGEDWAVWSWSRPEGGRWDSVAQVVMACITTVCFGLNEVRCVTVNVDAHVPSVKTDGGVWLCGSVIHQHLRLFDGVDGGRSLLRANFVECDEHGGTDGA